jgi:hypothetical protein
MDGSTSPPGREYSISRKLKFTLTDDRETWTTIQKSDGTVATFCTHRDCNAGERRAFEDASVARGAPTSD